ncbi:hypothetical protein PAXRUDRAFT_832792, partial [Paxillus rubicundulus Ve08.2h10]
KKPKVNAEDNAGSATSVSPSWSFKPSESQASSSPTPPCSSMSSESSTAPSSSFSSKSPCPPPIVVFNPL